MFYFHSPNSVSTLRGSYGRGSRPVLDRGAHSGFPSFFVYFFCIKWLQALKLFLDMSICISTAQTRTKCGLRPRRFTCKFSHKLAITGSYDMMKRISTAQSRTKFGPRPWPTAFYFKFLRKWLLSYDEADSDWAGSHKVWVVVLGSVPLLINIITGSRW